MNLPGHNLCYMNATFQCLLACPPVMSALEQECSNTCTGIARALLDIFLPLQGRSGSDHIIPTKEIKKELPGFHNRNQQDAYHFLLTMVGGMEQNLPGKITLRIHVLFLWQDGYTLILLYYI